MGSCVKQKYRNFKPRDVSPMLIRIRDLLLGRKHTTALRFAQNSACRTQPQPNIPLGPSSKLYHNYYFRRNARGVVKPPVVLYKGKTVKLPTDDECVCPPCEEIES